MSRVSIRSVVLATSCGCAFALTARMAPAAAPDVATVLTPSSQAASLVQAALDAEQAGDAAQRSALLEKAIAADPDFAPARWQSGHVMFDGKWRTPEQVELLVATHDRWVAYREFRDSLEGTAEDHEELARYCQKNGLEREARYHWANVLLAAPDHAEARKALDLIPYRDGLYVKQDVADLEKQAHETARRLKKALPQMARLCRDVTRGSAEERTAALATIEALSDPGVLDALQQAADKATKKFPEHAAELYQAVVSALSNMPQHDATLRLLNYAVYAETPSVRQQAAESLRTRPQTDYMPLLMAALTGELDVETELLVQPNGAVQLLETVTQARPTEIQKNVRSVNYDVDNGRGVIPRRFNPARALTRNVANATGLASTTAAQVSELNAEADAMNGRISEVLNIAVGTPLSAKPQTLWQQWQEFNELQFKISAETVNIYVTNVSEPSSHSCFAPGTIVWTHGGPRPIEEIIAGDFVLSQNPANGEVDYRPVLKTTLGDPTKVMELAVGEDRIVATLGHRFWVGGQGWTMTKHLQPSAQLHSLTGPMMLEYLEPREEVACHNLVVEGFHTYFIGESKLLVHDIECPRPTLGSLPGSTTLRKVIPLDLTTRMSRWQN